MPDTLLQLMAGLVACLVLGVSTAGAEEPVEAPAEEPVEAPAEESVEASAESDGATEEVVEEDVGEAASPFAAARARVEAALHALASLETALAADDGTDPTLLISAARNELHDALAALGAAEERARIADLLDARLPAADEPEPSVPTGGGAVSARDLEEVRRAIESAPFKDDKMQVLRTTLSAARVSSAQVEALLELFTLSSHRVDALVFLHPRITDPEKFDGLLATLKFESDREAVRERLGLGG